jgi:hypothetical protein
MATFDMRGQTVGGNQVNVGTGFKSTSVMDFSARCPHDCGRIATVTVVRDMHTGEIQHISVVHLER